MNNKVIAKTIYETTDGTYFSSLEEAEKHQEFIVLYTLLLKDKDFYNNAINVCNVPDFRSFLERNADWIKPMMGWK